MAKSSTSFKKGQSGNPGGKPKVDPEIQKLLTSNLRKSIEKIISLRDSSEDEVIQFKCASYLVDRLLGKPAQAVNLGDQDGAPLSIQVIVREKSQGG